MKKPKKPKPRLHTHILVVDKKTYGLVPTVNLVELAVYATGITPDAVFKGSGFTKNHRFVTFVATE